MAKKYGFDYEFVTYKWPHWLHKQSDKQRIIWAYKILFLDVLFPLDLKKVIFLDADQIIRADIADLWNMDLQVRAVLGSRAQGRRSVRPKLLGTPSLRRALKHGPQGAYVSLGLRDNRACAL